MSERFVDGFTSPPAVFRKQAPQLRDKCPGSQAFPTSYNGENTRCPECKRLLKLHVNGKVPNHNRGGKR